MMSPDELRKKKRKIEVNSEYNKKVQEFEKVYGKPIEINGYKLYKVQNKFYEVVKPVESELDNSKYYWGTNMSNVGISGFQLFLSKEKYEKSSIVVLREVVPVLDENGLSVKPSKEITILTKNGTFGKYVCKEEEWVSDICDESFVIVHDTIDDTVVVKDMYYGDTLIRETEPNSIHYYDDVKMFVASSAYGNTKITLAEFYEEFEKRKALNHKLKDFGITVGQAKSIVWEYNRAKENLDKENEVE